MKKCLFFFTFLFNVCFIKAQHYTQGVSVDTVLYTGTYSFPGSSCSGSLYPDITLDSALFNYVNGLEFMILVDSIIYGPPPQFSPVHSGDTFLLNSAAPVYSVPVYGLVFQFRLKLVGTPTTAGQNFPCAMDYLQCTCNCYHMIIQPSISDVSVCTVDLLNTVNDTNKQSKLLLYPNPADNKLSVSGISQNTSIKLYNSFGTLVIEQISDHDIILETGSLPEGIYTLFISEKSAGEKIAIGR